MPECMFVIYEVLEGTRKEYYWIPGIGVTDNSEPPFGCWEPKLDPL